jgi:hypothetical protein
MVFDLTFGLTIAILHTKIKVMNASIDDSGIACKKGKKSL